MLELGREDESRNIWVKKPLYGKAVTNRFPVYLLLNKSQRDSTVTVARDISRPGPHDLSECISLVPPPPGSPFFLAGARYDCHVTVTV